MNQLLGRQACHNFQKRSGARYVVNLKGKYSKSKGPLKKWTEHSIKYLIWEPWWWMVCIDLLVTSKEWTILMKLKESRTKLQVNIYEIVLKIFNISHNLT